jgi:hypothetical protein
MKQNNIRFEVCNEKVSSFIRIKNALIKAFVGCIYFTEKSLMHWT